MTHSFPTRRSSGLGEVGEVVVTTLNADYPLLRFATGDLSATMPGTSPCGRTAPRIRGWMGRADQTTKVKGMRSEEHTSELQSLMRISYAVFCLKKKTHTKQDQ